MPNNPQGGPSQGRKDPPTDDRDNQKIQSRDELQDRSHGQHGGSGRRNGSSKHR